MAITETAPAGIDSYQEAAQRHLWLHFTPMGKFGKEREIPIIVRGEGCYVWDEHGKRYLDGLAALFCVNVGHGRAELAEAAAAQARELAFYTNWWYAHPRAIELATRVSSLAPGDLNRVFFVSGGSEANESAIKLARQYHKVTGHPNKTKIVSRLVAYHGTSLGALSATAITGARAPFEPIAPGGCHVANTNLYRLSPGTDPSELAEAVRDRIMFEDPETVAAVIMEPVQTAGGSFPPPPGYFQRVREICDEFGVLLIADEVITGWGRLGHWFGAQRYEFQPDVITTAKGITSAYAQLGAVIFSDRIAEPFLDGGNMFAHGFTFGGHPVACAVALANIDLMERERLPEHVLSSEDAFREMLDSLRDIPIVGDVRGAGYLWAIELVTDQATKARFEPDEIDSLIRGFLAGDLFERGLLCRTDADRGDPIVQLAPPLTAGPEQFEEMRAMLRPALEEASRRMS
jgi:adenosylmethionine-8-amino-7-oxononanoate aminotransferase